MRWDSIFFALCMWCTFLDATQWVNWAENQMCHPSNIFSPASLEEIQNIIKRATYENKHVRAIGSGHSWTDILCSNGFMIKPENLNQILELDTEKKQIRVQAGVTLKELVTFLAKYNLALPNQPAVTEQTIAGAISTGTHGTGHTSTMADFIVSIELVIADGSIYKLSQNNCADFFAAARVSIGSIGIIYAVTIQCVSLFKLKHIQYQTSWEDIKNNYNKLLQDNDFFSFLYQVQEDFVAVDMWNRTQEPLSATYYFKLQNAVKSVYNWLLDKLKIIMPNVITSDAILKIDKPIVEYSYEALSGPPSTFYLEEEIAVEQSHLPEVIEKLKSLILSYKKKGILIYAIICRFVQADKISYLSPASGRDVVFMSVSMPYKEENDFYQDFYELMLQFDGRPHWGKINYLTYKDTQKLYGQNFDKFLAVRKQLDPYGMFSNSFTKRVFGW